MMDNILNINDLAVSFHTFNGVVQAVRGVSFKLQKGQTLAIVGESGSGKSVTAQSIVGLIPKPPGEIVNGSILLNGEDLTKKTEKQMEHLRGKQIGMIFQDPMTSLNPTMTVGRQITEGIIKHQKLSKSKARARALELLKVVGIPNPEARFKQHPHQFSGGMRQRVVIAIALACNPKVLIADEPTTALDVTIQSQILNLMKQLQQRFDMSIIMITHDLGVVANVAERVVVMYGGKIVETGVADEIFYKAKHPYTWGLLSSIPKTGTQKEGLMAIPGSPPDLSDPPKGCPFAPRCPHSMKVCSKQMPEYTEVSDSHKIACWLLDERAPKVEPPSVILAGRGK